MEKNINNTQFFTVQKEPELQVSDVLEIVYKALKEKGYNPVNQIVGYIMSGDPTYITSHNNARSLIMKRRSSQYMTSRPVRLASISPNSFVFSQRSPSVLFMFLG